LGLLLVGSLLLAPAAWASGEDVREQDAAAQSDKKKEDATKRQDETAGKPEAAAEGSRAASEEPAAETTEKTGVDPSFNTVEDILAYRGPLDSLWPPRSASEPQVTWREVDARPEGPR
jgi:hypothetical protein